MWSSSAGERVPSYRMVRDRLMLDTLPWARMLFTLAISSGGCSSSPGARPATARTEIEPGGPVCCRSAYSSMRAVVASRAR